MNNRAGFTLIEILIALVIFSIIATLTSAILYQSYSSRDRVNSIADQFNQMQLAFALLERDTFQIVARSVLGNDMRSYPEFIGEPTRIEFTRAGYANPAQKEQRATLQRISYACSDSKLLRRYWYELDTLDRTRYREKVVLTDLEACYFEFINRNLQTLEKWRPQKQPRGFRYPKAELIPKAIIVHFQIKSRGSIQLTYIIPEAAYATVRS